MGSLGREARDQLTEPLARQLGSTWRSFEKVSPEILGRVVFPRCHDRAERRSKQMNARCAKSTCGYSPLP